jgi:hypothetical protein
MSTTTTGRNWLEMTPGHFDTSRLPARHRKPEPAGLFDVADVAASPAKPSAPATPQLDGQLGMFGLPEQEGELWG